MYASGVDNKLMQFKLITDKVKCLIIDSYVRHYELVNDDGHVKYSSLQLHF